MAFVDRIQAKAARKYDQARRRFVGDDARCFLLKRAGQRSSFVVVSEITSGWFYQFSEFRGQMKLTVATSDPQMSDQMAQTSYIALGRPAADGSIDLYSINPEGQDVVPPDGTSPFWKVYLTKETSERYH